MKNSIIIFLITIAITLRLSGQYGLLQSYQKISPTTSIMNNYLDNSDYFGISIDSIGDLNLDGVTDLVVGACLDDDGGSNSGAVYLLMMNSNKTIKSVKKISRLTPTFLSSGITNGNYFGRSVAGVGDINKDGIPDIAVGAEMDSEGGTYTGSIRIILLDTNGTVKGFQKISKNNGYGLGGLPISTGGKFGIDISLIGDINGDNKNDIVVGSFWDNGAGTNQGAVWILQLDSTGKVLQYNKIQNGDTNFSTPLSNNDYFGVSVAGIGDFDFDGINDIAVGAYEDDEGGTNNGSVYIIKLLSNGNVKGFHKISNSIPGALLNQISSSTQMGVSIASIQDIDGNGVKDLFIGNYDNPSVTGSAIICLLNINGVVIDAKFINSSNFS